MKRLIRILVMLAIGNVLCPRLAMAQAESLKVATFNICWGNTNLPVMLQSIRDSNADVVCLQETTAASEAVIRRHLRTEYPDIRFSGHGGRFRAERFGVLSKLPISNYEFHRPVGRFFGFVTFAVDSADTKINVVNVHLAPFTLQRPRSLKEVMQQLGATEVQHQTEINAIMKFVDKKTPTIIAGDFNSLTGFQAPQRLKKDGFVDSFAAVTDNPDQHPTWFWPLSVGNAQLRIDYVFHSRHFRTVKSSVDASNASDHRLLASELQLSPM